MEKCVCSGAYERACASSWLLIHGVGCPRRYPDGTPDQRPGGEPGPLTASTYYAIFPPSARVVAAFPRSSGHRLAADERSGAREAPPVAVQPTPGVRGAPAGAGFPAQAGSVRTGICADCSVLARRCAVETCVAADTLPGRRWAGQAIQSDASAWQPRPARVAGTRNGGTPARYGRDPDGERSRGVVWAATGRA